MRVPEQWLRAYTNPALSTQALADQLTMAGLEVEDISASAPPFSGVVVGKIVGAEKHPDADRLKVCQVDVGDGKLRQIVCGAPNAAVGLHVPCALPGAQLPGGLSIKAAKMRGVESQGMLCSATELGLSEDASGLLVLASDTTVGQDLRDCLSLDEQVLTLKLTPNRADCLSMIGVAREVAALNKITLTIPQLPAPTVSHADILPIKIQAPDLCGRFSGRLIRGVNHAAPTPEWMKRRLERAGQRSISVLVDISNYVMLERGRPSHIFDADKVAGGLIVRWGRPGERLALLNGETVELAGDVGVICDFNDKPESLAGIMGGLHTAVSESTQHVFVEAAFWWPAAIAGRARRYKFSTEASHRFERGVEFATTAQDVDYISALIVQLCGGECGPLDDHIVDLPARTPVSMRVARANKVIGLSLSAEQCLALLQSLGLQAQLEEAAGEQIITVVPPSHRFDLEIEEDLIEEVARLYGFENLPMRPPMATAAMMASPEAALSLISLKHRVADRDYQEVVNFSFAPEAMELTLRPDQTPIKLLNPIAEQLNVMRTSLWPSLLSTLQYNLNRKAGRVRIFEAGRIFEKHPGQLAGPLQVAGVHQPMKLALLAYGSAEDEQWGQTSRGVDFFDLKADVEALADASGEGLLFEALPHAALHPGRSARISLRRAPRETIGWIGELHPSVQQQLGLSQPVLLAELELSGLLIKNVAVFEDVSKFPPVIRDLALTFPAAMPAQNAFSAIANEKRENPLMNVLQNVKLFDEYRGKLLETKEKSLAFRVVLQDTQKTLSDAQADDLVAALVARLGKECGGKLRS
jgi:phenylalanyl-tRNA synthetase beta chain